MGYELFALFAGNTTDVTAVETTVITMEARYGPSNRIWVMDRGMISVENEFLRQTQRRYIVGTPKPMLLQPVPMQSIPDSDLFPCLQRPDTVLRPGKPATISLDCDFNTRSGAINRGDSLLRGPRAREHTGGPWTAVRGIQRRGVSVHTSLPRSRKSTGAEASQAYPGIPSEDLPQKTGIGKPAGPRDLVHRHLPTLAHKLFCAPDAQVTEVGIRRRAEFRTERAFHRAAREIQEADHVGDVDRLVQVFAHEAHRRG